MKKTVIIFLGCLLLIFHNKISAAAGTIYNSPYVHFSPDRRAWTTDADDRNTKWYREDGSDDVFTGMSSALAEPEEGEHYYNAWRVGNIPISCWKVSLSKVNCCHLDYPPLGEDYHGIPFVRQVCLKPHYSAWIPYCADCGQAVQDINFYMSKEAAESISCLEVGTGLAYYYLCPHNHNLEQGVDLNGHLCKAVSKNRYRVDYLPNTGGETYAGYMESSWHFYDNATLYEGREVTPQTRLNPNRFQRIGWKFCGWNTKADGSGVFYPDEAEIENLCTAQYDPETDAGRVELFAVWERCSGQLDILLDGCAYKDITGVYSVIRQYGENYEADPEQLTPPSGYRVSFETMGGNELPAIYGQQSFSEWIACNALAGRLEGNRYWFYGPDRNIDTIQPVFVRKPIILPKPVLEGKAFGGWYYDRDFLKFAGSAGSSFAPQKDVTLYARWVDLHLNAEDNYSIFEGSGGVDLQWTQPDGSEKVYQVYQSIDGVNWDQIFTTSDIGKNRIITRTYTGDGKIHIYIAPYSGLYQIEAYGAQGGNYAAYSGGKGGCAKGIYWLNKGERIVIRAGKQLGDDSGGRGNPYGNGGGYSSVETDQKGLLIMAGGGGGAGENGNGLPGGSLQGLVVNSHTGESGGSGGGGGYCGGHAGELLVHHHIAGVCNHVHTGNPTRYGGCYTVPVICGRELDHEYTGSETWYWGGSDEEYCPNCGADASKGETCTGHETDYYSHSCPIHGNIEDNTDSSEPSVCTQIAYYDVGCGRTEDYICGYTDNQVISSKPAYGGSSYTNPQFSTAHFQQPGVWCGDGMVCLQAYDVGYIVPMEISGVKATDQGKPKIIHRETVERSVDGRNMIHVHWEEPEDNGTVYFHQVKSYTFDTLENIGISNVTENNLISGIRGYYYCVDMQPERDYRSLDYFFTDQTDLQFSLKDKAQYLHLLAVDIAGNMGDILHISLGTRRNGPEDVMWKLHTEKLSLKESAYARWNRQEGVYYVKCDGTTPFLLEYAAYMDGPAAACCQLNYNIIESSAGDDTIVRDIVYIPSQDIPGQEEELKAGQLEFYTEGEPEMHRGAYTVVQRTDNGKRIYMKQEEILNREVEGQRIWLVPVAGAQSVNGVRYSNRMEDEQNGVFIIGDGTAPVIYGMEAMDGMSLLDRRDRQVTLLLTAEDALSGVKDFYVQIENKDNGARQKFFPDTTGKIQIELTEDIPVFSGDFTVTATAEDNVGNINTVTCTTLEFDLQTNLSRILEPHDPVFKKGESGVLTITTWGYVERVEVEFPEEMAELDESMDRVFVYDMKTAYKQEESFVFQVPLYTPENTDYQVTVRAYKGDAMLEQRPAFAVMDVSGTVLDELRTRLR